MNMHDLNNRFFSTFDRVPVNTMLLILFSILLIFIGASISILLFTYNATINLVESNQEQILVNKDLNRIIINNTREVPLQNKEILTDIDKVIHFLGDNFNQTFIRGIYENRAEVQEALDTVIENQRLIVKHINQTSS